MSKHALATALLMVGVSVPALAQPSEPIIRIAYGDLNLATDSGVKALDRRIASAIDGACPDEPHADLQTERVRDHCRRERLSEVVAQRSRALASFRPSGSMITTVR
jgi:UrcA family protein